MDYSSPELKGLFEGFNVQWGWFEDDDWGAALRYKNTFNDTWMFSANVAYENLRDERLQAGGGGEATGPIIIPPSTSKDDVLPARVQRVGRFDCAQARTERPFRHGQFQHL